MGAGGSSLRTFLMSLSNERSRNVRSVHRSTRGILPRMNLEFLGETRSNWKGHSVDALFACRGDSLRTECFADRRQNNAARASPSLCESCLLRERRAPSGSNAMRAGRAFARTAYFPRRVMRHLRLQCT